MGSASAQIDGGPRWLNWHEENGTEPHETIAQLRALLNNTRGRDCPDDLWDPNRRYPDRMKKYWRQFLELRLKIKGQVVVVAKRLPRKLEGLQWVDLQGRLVSCDQAAANYLRYLPPELIPAEASAFLSPREVRRSQEADTLLVEQLCSYIPDFDRWLTRMSDEQAQHRDAMTALHQLGCLRSRFGDFTLVYRESRLRTRKDPVSGKRPHSPYDMRADIAKHVAELVTLQRTVGPIERAIFWFWHKQTVPESLRSPLPGNVTHFLRQFADRLDEADAQLAFDFVSRLPKPDSSASIDPDAALRLAEDISQIIKATGTAGPGLMTLNMLRAIVLSQQPSAQSQLVREQLPLAGKQVLRLTYEYEADLALLEAIQAQYKS